MNDTSLRTGLLAVVLGLAAAMDAGAADIYKTFDENGNVVYTDRPPTPDSKPISLRELSVVDAPDYSVTSTSGNQQASDPSGEPTLNELRMMYREFKLVSPAPEQSIWGTGQVATIAWDAGQPLTDGLSVIFYLDDQAVTEPTRAATFSTDPLDRGQHSARVDLIGPDNRVIASAGPVTFYIRQNSRLFNQPGRVPRG